MRVRKNKLVSKKQPRTVTINGIDLLTLTFILRHAKDSLDKDKTESVAVKSLNQDLLRICVELQEFLAVDVAEVKDVREVG